MVLRRTAAVRAGVFISAFVVGQFWCAIGADGADKKHASDPPSSLQRDINDIQSTLKAEKQQIDQLISTTKELSADYQALPKITDEQINYLKSVDAARAKFEAIQTKLDKTANDIEQTAERVSGSEMSVSYNYFTIFGLVFTLLLAVASLLGTLGAFIIRNVVSNSVRKDVEGQIQQSAASVENEMRDRAHFETNLARADTLFQVAYAWWQHYENDFQKFLQGKKTAAAGAVIPAPEDTLRDIRLSKNFAQMAMPIVNTQEFRDAIKTDGRSWLTRSRLINLWVYDVTAEFLCENASLDSAKKIQVLELADALIELAKNEFAQKPFLWYDLHETAAFAMTSLGNQGTQDRGIDLIRDVCQKKKPSNDHADTPDSYITQLKRDYAIP